MDTLHAFRWGVLLLIAGTAVLAFQANGRVTQRKKEGAGRVCVSVWVMRGILASFTASSLGAAIQLMVWMEDKVEFAWHRSPLMAAVCFVHFLTLLVMINFVYPVRYGTHKDTKDVPNL